MAKSGWNLTHVFLHSALIPFIVLSTMSDIVIPTASAQQMRGEAVEGYITALHLPAGFDVNGQHVVLQPDTGYGLEKDKQTSSGSPLRDAVEVGAYVFVLGSFDNRTKTATARTVLLRDDWDRKLIGLGVIDRVVFAGPEPVFQADGYRIRITHSTETAFHGEVKTLADVGTNTWLRYEGRRDKDGALLASKAGFLPGKTIKIKAVAGVESVDMQLEEPDLAGHKDGRVKIAWMSGWRKIPADRDLQERIKRVGLSVIPA